jgi:structural maintenance of chromosomes protein 6
LECPFRLLDEYDVFMDEAARGLSLQMMQNYAMSPDQKNRQFLILTPHRINGVVTNNFIRIKNMPEPERLSAHGLQQQVIG